jgi:hypothetical protein
MKLMFKLLVVSGIAFGAFLIMRGRRERLAPDREPVAPNAIPDLEGTVLDAELVIGISQVDTSSFTQIAGEGIDLDTADALEPRDQRERLPIRGKNVP